jgi:CubicO group peptidase (beta-lactamase class C family)
MVDTSFYLPAEKRSRLASLYTYEDGKLKLTQHDWGQQKPAIPSPAGGLISTAEDLSRFNEMMRNGDTLAGERVLSEGCGSTHDHVTYR